MIPRHYLLHKWLLEICRQVQGRSNKQQQERNYQNLGPTPLATPLVQVDMSSLIHSEYEISQAPATSDKYLGTRSLFEVAKFACKFL